MHYYSLTWIKCHYLLVTFLKWNSWSPVSKEAFALKGAIHRTNECHPWLPFSADFRPLNVHTVLCADVYLKWRLENLSDRTEIWPLVALLSNKSWSNSPKGGTKGADSFGCSFGSWNWPGFGCQIEQKAAKVMAAPSRAYHEASITCPL